MPLKHSPASETGHFWCWAYGFGALKRTETMRKTIAAVTAGLLLVAGQAAAANTSAVARVGDRVGATAEANSEIAGVPFFVLLIGAAVVIATVVVATDDSSESN